MTPEPSGGHGPFALQQPKRTTGLAETRLGRLLRIFAATCRYQRLGARSEARNGGEIPGPELGGFLSGWSREVLSLLRLEVQLVGALAPLQTPALLVGNHLSYLDIPLLWSQVPVVLLGKAEIANWPVFGSAGRRAGMIFVQRDSDGSRKEATAAMTRCLQARGLGIGLFPAGTTSLYEERPWHSGAFKIAKAAGVPVQPFRITYDPLRPAAFIGRDSLVPHLYRLLNAGPIRATLEFGPPRMLDHPDSLALDLWKWSRNPTRIAAE
jgi:1-acyl-sn-glycerol-3-phosphate acyltransferase